MSPRHRKAQPLIIRLPQEAVRTIQGLRRSNAAGIHRKRRKDRYNTEREATREAQE